MSGADKDPAAGGEPPAKVQAKAPAPPHPLRPTVVPAPPAPPQKRPHERASTERGAPTPAPPRPGVARPTAMPGVERRRIEVAPRDLERLSPGASAAVVRRAREIVSALVVETLTERTAILWGHALQTAYRDLVTAALAEAQSPLVRQVDAYLTRMMDLLGSIDLVAVAGPGAGGVGALFRSLNQRIDTPEELRAAQRELDQLVAYLSAALGDLLDLRDRCARHAASVDRLAIDVEGAALAALYLAERLQADRPAVAERFTERSISLTQTLAQIRSGDALRTVQTEQPLRMVRAVQDVVLVMMPGFLGGLASALTLIQKHDLTPTQAGALTYQLRDILHALHH